MFHKVYGAFHGVFRSIPGKFQIRKEFQVYFRGIQWVPEAIKVVVGAFRVFEEVLNSSNILMTD